MSLSRRAGAIQADGKPKHGVFPDADACLGTTFNDCFAWNETEGRGSFKWTWIDCCTDGMVMGRMPFNSFTMNIKWTSFRGAFGVSCRLRAYLCVYYVYICNYRYAYA